MTNKNRLSERDADATRAETAQSVPCAGDFLEKLGCPTSRRVTLKG